MVRLWLGTPVPDPGALLVDIHIFNAHLKSGADPGESVDHNSYQSSSPRSNMRKLTDAYVALPISS